MQVTYNFNLYGKPTFNEKPPSRTIKKRKVIEKIRLYYGGNVLNLIPKELPDGATVEFESEYSDLDEVDLCYLEVCVYSEEENPNYDKQYEKYIYNKQAYESQLARWEAAKEENDRKLAKDKEDAERELYFELKKKYEKTN